MTDDLASPIRTGPGQGITEQEVTGFVDAYLRQHGLADLPSTTDTKLADLGLDSLSTADLLLTARAGLVEAGRLDPDASLLDLPILTTVGDLGALLRSLATT